MGFGLWRRARYPRCMPSVPAIFNAPFAHEQAEKLLKRSRARRAQLTDQAVSELLSDTVYQERRRYESDRPEPGEAERVERAATAIAHDDRPAMERSLDELITAYTEEIHNRFSPRAYAAATRVLPQALTRLVTATDPARLLSGDFDPDRRIVVQGHIDMVRGLCERGTVILAPTHLSNLDSPLIGYCLFRAGLPPFAYGAGLNLFTNPVMAFWMSRLGAYTIDRRKNGLIYKETLKDYSVELFRGGFHSLFFPGGTRSRSGMVEKSLKKGLLGTGLQAWQENLHDARPNPDVFVVPMTLSTSLVLEAETLISDALAAEGKSRYIINDDEFSDAGTVFSFLRRVLNLDSAIYATFSQPMDVLGNPVNAQGESLGPDGAVIDRRRYVCDANGQVEWDEQRDRVYTERLARALVRAFHRDNVALPTHLAAMAAWRALKRRHPRLDTWRLVRLGRDERLVPKSSLMEEITSLREQVGRLAVAGHIRAALPEDADDLLQGAISRFDSYHTRRTIELLEHEVRIDPELALYYRNRLVGYGLDGDAVAAEVSA